MKYNQENYLSIRRAFDTGDEREIEQFSSLNEKDSTNFIQDLRSQKGFGAGQRNLSMENNT